ncbi:MAG: hypothetical protein IT330_15840 [Anaerolineae bacterium]|nr:hypothetical protein [Anaerolineae bacterium]
MVMALFTALPLAGCTQQPAVSSSPPEEPKPKTTVAASPIPATAGQTQYLEKAVPLEIYSGLPAASIEEAVSRLHFPVVMPKVLPEGYKLDAVLTNYPESGVEYLKLIYINGKYHLGIAQQPREEPAPNLSDAYVAELRQEKVTVGNHVGLGHGPGISRTKEAFPEYASVTWTPPGLQRIVASLDDPNLTLEDILAVAESMEAP